MDITKQKKPEDIDPSQLSELPPSPADQTPAYARSNVPELPNTPDSGPSISSAPSSQPLAPVEDQALVGQTPEPAPAPIPSTPEINAMSPVPQNPNENVTIPYAPATQPQITDQDIADTKALEQQNKDALKAKTAAQNAVVAHSINQQSQYDKDTADINARIAKTESDIKNLSLDSIFKDEKAPISKLQAGIAIMLGALGQGYTGSSTNAGLVAVNKTLDDYAAKNKYTLEKKLEMQNQVLSLIKDRLNNQIAKTDDQNKKASISLAQQQLDLQKGQVQQQLAKEYRKQQLISKSRQGDMTPQEQQEFEASLTPEETERKVRLYDGRLQLADSKDAANKVREASQEYVPAIQGLNRLLDLAKNGSKFSLEDRARIGTEITKLIGTLRLPFTGPGVLQQSERDAILSAIGDPRKFSDLVLGTEKPKIMQTILSIESDLRNKYKLAGINAPKGTQEAREEQVQKIMQQAKGKLSHAQASEALDRALNNIK